MQARYSLFCPFLRFLILFLPHLAFLDLPAPWDAIGHAKSALRVRTP